MKDRKIIDGHAHLGLSSQEASFAGIADMEAMLGIFDKINVLNIVLWQGKNLIHNPATLYLKWRNPDKIFSMAGIPYPEPEDREQKWDYEKKAQDLIAAGFDGIKLFGKPTARQGFGVAFDAAIFDGLYAYLEAEQVPVLFHVGDPKEFWDEDLAPDWAKNSGWFYKDGFPLYEDFYKEVEGVLSRYPRLRICFPHFYFLSDDLDRLDVFLRRYPTVFIDITPGTELYSNLGKNISEAKAFFVKYQDRIFFGTDNTGRSRGATQTTLVPSTQRRDTICEFLETHTSTGFGVEIEGLALPEAILEKIYSENFYRFMNTREPKPVTLVAVKQATKTALAEAKRRKDGRGAVEELESLLAALVVNQ